MLELIIGKGHQVRVCMQVMDMDSIDTALATALVHARGVCAQESSSLGSSRKPHPQNTKIMNN